MRDIKITHPEPGWQLTNTTRVEFLVASAANIVTDDPKEI